MAVLFLCCRLQNVLYCGNDQFEKNTDPYPYCGSVSGGSESKLDYLLRVGEVWQVTKC